MRVRLNVGLRIGFRGGILNRLRRSEREFAELVCKHGGRILCKSFEDVDWLSTWYAWFRALDAHSIEHRCRQKNLGILRRDYSFKLMREAIPNYIDPANARDQFTKATVTCIEKREFLCKS